MRKFLIMAITAVAAVMVLAIPATADKGTDGTSWEFNLKPNTAGDASSSVSIGEPAKKADDGTYVAPKDQTFNFPKTSRVDTTAMPQCKKTPSEVGGGEECPKNTLLGDGFANVVVGQTPGKPGTPLVAEFTAYNQPNKILFIFQTCGGGTGPGTGEECEPAGPPNIVVGDWSNVKKAPKLFVPTPDALLDIGVIITKFQLNTKKHVKKKKGKIVKSYIFNPEVCKKKWATSVKANYIDGTSQTIKDTQKCKK